MGGVLTEDQAIAETIILLNHYGFELEGHTAPEVIAIWKEQYPVDWLRPAVLESLYRGRYKKISVEEILRVWEKWEKPKLNFNSEFETLISAKLNDGAEIPLTPQPEPALVADVDLLPPIPPVLPLITEVSLSHRHKADSIERFQPPSDLESSDAYQKLKAIATQPQPVEPAEVEIEPQ